MNSYKLHVRVLVLDEVPGSGGIPNVQRHNASHILIGIQKNGGIPMLKVKQVTVSLENQPGRLAAVASVLADAKVNIEAVLGSTAGAQGSVQLVVDNVAKAKKALSAAQFIYTEGTLEHVELPNKAGALAALQRNWPRPA